MYETIIHDSFYSVAQGIQIQYISDTPTKGSSPDKNFCHYRPTNTNIHILIIQQSNKPNTNPIDHFTFSSQLVKFHLLFQEPNPLIQFTSK